eukprot:COSAG01_NODE_14237_length_1479_cov_1.105797_3_plen_88_part_01
MHPDKPTAVRMKLLPISTVATGTSSWTFSRIWINDMTPGQDNYVAVEVAGNGSIMVSRPDMGTHLTKNAWTVEPMVDDPSNGMLQLKT